MTTTTTAGGGRTSATKDVAELINRLDAAGVKALVLDLRNNGGGLLSEAIDLTGLFINKGPGGAGEIGDGRSPGRLATRIRRSRYRRSAGRAGFALQRLGLRDRRRRAPELRPGDHHRRPVDPRQGLGPDDRGNEELHRLLARLPDKTGAARLTIQKFYLPNGSSTQNKGIVPDIVLPSVDEYLPIGESDLPHALIWDEIPSTVFSGRPLDQKLVASLRESSQSRLDHMEEFAYLKKGIAWFKDKQERKDISLNLDGRRHQKELDDAFKKAMRAEKEKLSKTNFQYTEINLAPPPPKPVKAEAKTDDESYDEEEPSTDEESGAVKVDIPLRETLRVLSDALTLSKNPTYWADGNAPLTVQISKHG